MVYHSTVMDYSSSWDSLFSIFRPQLESLQLKEAEPQGGPTVCAGSQADGYGPEIVSSSILWGVLSVSERN